MKKNIKDAVKIIEDDFLPGDIIAHSCVPTVDSFLCYLRKVPARQRFVIIAEESDNKYWRDKFISGEKDRKNRFYKKKYDYGYLGFEFCKKIVIIRESGLYLQVGSAIES